MPAAKDGLIMLTRAGLPVDTVGLARYLIGKVVVRKTRQGVMSGRIVKPKPIQSVIQRVMPMAA